jgi:tRNA (adenine22-N1)-methyltransferase
MKRKKLSDRLKALADLVDDGVSVADIGTDHGLLPVYFAQEGTYRRIIATDKSAASLDSARRLAIKKNVAESIKFVVTSGLDGISPTEVDTIIIAGLGGETILSILKDTPWTNRKKINLILQPQSKTDMLLRFLYDSGYAVIDIKYVLDRGKRYTIIVATGEAH